MNTTGKLTFSISFDRRVVNDKKSVVVDKDGGG